MEVATSMQYVPRYAYGGKYLILARLNSVWQMAFRMSIGDMMTGRGRVPRPVRQSELVKGGLWRETDHIPSNQSIYYTRKLHASRRTTVDVISCQYLPKICVSRCPLLHRDICVNLDIRISVINMLFLNPDISNCNNRIKWIYVSGL